MIRNLPTLLRSSSAMSVIEVIIVLLIVTVGIAGAYQIVSSGTKLADTTEYRIQAIAYAREGLEGIENIRDTNWIKFSSDYTGCFDVFGYDVTCVGSDPAIASGVPRITTGSYTITSTGGLWQLARSAAPTTATIAGAGRTAYLNEYALYTNSDGLTTQSGGLTGIPLCTTTLTRNCKTRFARELRVTRPDVNTIVTEAVVSWVDPSKLEPFEVVLSATLKNWKMAYYGKTPVIIGNSCAANPVFPNLGVLSIGTPTSSNQSWIYSATPGSCTYACTGGYSGTGCATPPPTVCTAGGPVPCIVVGPTLLSVASVASIANAASCTRPVFVGETIWSVILNGTSGDDILIAGCGGSSFYGNDGNDLLIWAWNHSFQGGNGNDTFYEGPGNSIFNGGAWRDSFIYNTLANGWSDAIGDFQWGAGGDIVIVAGAASPAALLAATIISGSDVMLVINGTTIVRIVWAAGTLTIDNFSTDSTELLALPWIP